jgi:hypothetical protein
MKSRKVQLNLYISEEYRDMLQKIAAERMLSDPKRSVTGSKVGAEIICEHLKKILAEERSIQNERHAIDNQQT